MSYLGLDLGTTAVKAVLLSSDGATVCDVRQEYDKHAMNEMGVQPITPVITAVTQCLSRLPSTSSIKAIQICGQMHGVMAWDDLENTSTTTECVTWQDRRCDTAFLAQISQQTQNQLYTGFGTATLLHDLLKPLNHWMARKYAGGVPEYIASLLTGNPQSYMSPSEAAAWGFFNKTSQDWDLISLEKLGSPWTAEHITKIKALMPPIRFPGDVIGVVSADMAKRFHLTEGAKIFVALGDNQSQVAAQAWAAVGASGAVATLETLRRAATGPDRPFFFNVGTSIQLGLLLHVNDTAGVKETGMLEIRPFVQDLRLLAISSLNGGNILSVLAEKIAALANALSSDGTLQSSDIFNALQNLEFDTDCKVCCVPRLFGDRGFAEDLMSFTNISVADMNARSLLSAVCRGLVENVADQLPSHLKARHGHVFAGGNAMTIKCLRAAVEYILQAPSHSAGGSAAEGAAMLCRCFYG